MKQFLGIDLQVKTVLSEWLDLLNGYVNNWESIRSTLKTELEERLFQKGELATYEDKNGTFQGVIQGITTDGKLELSTGNEIRTYHLKEIKFL